MIEVPDDDYEKALAVLSEMADRAQARITPRRVDIETPRFSMHGMVAGYTGPDSTYAHALAEAFNAVAAIRPRVPRDADSDLLEDR